MSFSFGINLIDTAPAYGNSEQRLGQLLADERQHWVICSKVGEEYASGESSFDFSPEHTRLSLDRSLRRLGTDYIDMVLVHSDGNDEDILDRFGTLEVLADAKRAGKIRAFGISTKTIAGGLRAAALSDVLMVTYNLGYRDEAPVLDRCKETGCGVILKKVLASGHLPSDVADPLAASLSFAFEHHATTAAIVGTINPVHLQTNINAARTAIEA